MKRAIAIVHVALLAVVLCSSVVHAVVWYVDANKASSGTGTSWAQAFKTIQEGVNAANPGTGDQVWVKKGSYSADATIAKAIGVYGGFFGNETALSQADPDKYPTIVDRASAGRCFSISADATLQGFVIKGGIAPAANPNGGGIYVAGASPDIRNCTFIGNSAPTGHGGAIHFVDGVSPKVVNCMFARNTSAQNGGAVFSEASGTTVTNCTFYQNHSGLTGAFFNTLGAATLTNCIFWDNRTAGDGNKEIDSSPTASINVSYSIVDQDGYAGSDNNLRQDPLFLDPVWDNLRLKPGSPAIAAGVCATFEGYHYLRIAPYSDFELDPRPEYGAIAGCDIGADEFTAIAVNTLADELNSDGDCSLREAIVAANTDSPIDGCDGGRGFDIIRAPGGLYTLGIAGVGEDACATGDLDMLGDGALVGDGPGVTIIDGGGLDRVIHIGPTGYMAIMSLTVRNGYLQVAANDGAGIHSSAIRLFVDNVEVADNVVEDDTSTGCGGILSGIETRVVRSSFHGNRGRSTGALKYSGSQGVSIKDSSFSENCGGLHASAVYAISGPAEITGSTFHHNGCQEPYFGRTVWVYSATLENLTISGNVGMGLYVDANSNAELTNCTIVGNSQQGIHVASSSSTQIRNTVVADNTAVPSLQCLGPVESLGHNLEDRNDCGFNAPGDLINTDPRLRPLADYGGPTLTHALFPGSPAINAGDATGCPATDQRGIPRPFGPACDIGAVEYAGEGAGLPFLLLLMDE
jgi:CSLREA domain-containing protein